VSLAIGFQLSRSGDLAILSIAHHSDVERIARSVSIVVGARASLALERAVSGAGGTSLSIAQKQQYRSLFDFHIRYRMLAINFHAREPEQSLIDFFEREPFTF
jgi:hypothetical protein